MPDAFRHTAGNRKKQPSSAGLGRGQTTLPQNRAPFLGREQEIRTIRDHLEHDEALVSIIGPGGVGKTRLALQIAIDRSSESPDGTIFVDLSPVQGPESVVPRIGQAFGIVDTSNRPVIDSIIAFLRSRQVLIVLDNCEHVLGAVPDIAVIIDACPAVQVLATSRAPLRLYGEHCVPISPLPLPISSALPLDSLLQSESVRLFIDRAQALVPGYASEDTEVRAIAEICKHLDGLPLAIELAAAKATLFPPLALLTHISDKLDLLVDGPRDGPPRHRTLRDTIAWSYALIGEADRKLFRHLAVFVDGFNIDAAREVADVSQGDILQRLSALAEQSLIQQSIRTGEGERFDVLETTREFALEQLETHDEIDRARQAHAAYFLHFAERMEDGIYGPEMRIRLDQLAVEYQNCRAALDHFIEIGDITREQRLAAMLSEYWCFRGRISEGISILERAIARNGKAQPVVLAKAMAELAFLYRVIAEDEAALSLSGAAVPLARQGDDIYRLSQVLFIRAYTLANEGGAQDQAIAVFKEAIALVEDLDPEVETYPALVADLGWAMLRAGHPKKGLELVNKALEMFEAGKRYFDLGWTRVRLGRMCERDGLSTLAARHYAESLRSFQAAGTVTQIGYPLSDLCHLLAACGHRNVADRFAGTIWELSEQTGAKFGHEPVGPPLPTDVTSAFRSWTIQPSDTGPALPLHDAIAEAIAAADALATGKIPAGAAPTTPAVALSDREREVLTLLAQRYTAPEIAEELFISVRTVERHIANTYNKLGVNSRRAAAAFAIRHGLI